MASEPMGEHEVRNVLSIAPFRRLWIALSLSSLGDWLGFVATTKLAAQFEAGYSLQLYAIASVLAVRLAPALLIGPVAGAWADRFNRRYTMVTADVLRFGLYASIPIVRTLWWLLVASFLIESLSLFWIPAKEASVPSLVPPNQLESANRLSLVTTYGSAAVASTLFALLSEVSQALGHGLTHFARNPIDLALYFDALTFLFSALTVWSLRMISSPRSADGAAGEERVGTWQSIVEGWKFIGSERWLRGLVVGILGAVAAGASAIGLSPRFVVELGAGNAGYGVLFATIFVGLATGMLVGTRVAGEFPRRRLMGVAIVAAGVALSLDAIMPNLLLAMACTFVMGLFAGIVWVVGITLVGLEVDDDKRGRTFAFIYNLMRLMLLAVVVAAPFIAGVIGQHSARVGGATLRLDGVTLTLFGGGIVAVVVGIVCLRMMDDRPDVPLRSDLAAALRHRSPQLGRGSGGVFIAFEGGEGAGKSTQARRLADALSAAGHEVVLTFEPGATLVGRQLRQVLLDRANTSMSPRAEAMLYAADRAQHVAEVIRPALERGAVVITDRYVDSSLAYQAGGRALDADEVRRLSRWATDGLHPDLTILLDIDPTVGLQRVTGPGDRLEAEAIEFHRRVRETFLDLARHRRDRYLVLDVTTMSADEALDRIVHHVTSRLMAAAPLEPSTPAPVHEAAR